MPDGEAPLGPCRGHVPYPGVVEPVSIVEPLDLAAIFGRTAPLAVDLGCGDGSFLVALATRSPDRNFLGIERLLGRVNSTAHKARNLENMRVLRFETSYAIRYLLPAGSVEQFYLLFPDPWPKRRHQRRRVVSADFLESIHTALAPAGRFYVATDQRDYFEQIRSLAGTTPARFEEIEPANGLPLTKFERRFQDQGAAIYRLELRKVSPLK